ncbi:MAG: adenylate kinase [Chloroflexota bacterium]|nr:adenylate kinase [Chloroflexota bacterium]MDE3194419.1 adenylate kinase [Chloroflexota bacterium]
MRRVSVVGTSSGAGKSTLGRRLAGRLDLPFVELDALFWRPQWAKPAADEFRERVARILAGDGWVVDGNYTSHLGDLVWQRADTVVWLDIPLRVSLWRTFRRTMGRIRTGEELWAGNRETFRDAFLKRENLFVYAIRTHRRRQRLFEERLASARYGHLAIHRFRSTRAAARWLELQSLGAAGAPATA